MRRNAVATKYYNLEQALKHKTNSGTIPFLIAHEVQEPYKARDGTEQLRTRVYYAFENIMEFQNVRNEYPHAHEIVWDRFISGKQQGRLIFDFDFKEPWAGIKPNFVPQDFEKKIEEMVILTFEKYYTNVDTSRFIFVWLVSDVTTKWSKHLIVKNAYFSTDWKIQSMVFYNLLIATIQERSTFVLTPIESLIDQQVARANATMRLCDSSKIGGNTLRLESPKNANFFDTLIQLYRREDIRVEQEIPDICLRKDLLTELFYNEPEKVMKNRFIKFACEKSYIDLSSYYEADTHIVTREEASNAFQLFERQYCEETGNKSQTMFIQNGTSGCFVNLKRIRSGPCWLSGKTHDSENAYLAVSKNAIHFFCHRGCVTKEGMKGIMIFKVVE